MLTQMRLLDRRTYIPIKLVEVMPREAKRLQKIETQKRNKARRERNELLKALQVPLISEELWKTFTEDRTSVEEAMATVGPDAGQKPFPPAARSGKRFAADRPGARAPARSPGRPGPGAPWEAASASPPRVRLAPRGAASPERRSRRL